MKNLLKLLIAVFAISTQAQVTSYDKLRVKELENKPQNSRVIVADENGNLNYKNQSEIQTDLTNYYTKPETNGLLNAKQNKLTAGSNVTISGNTISATDTKYNKGTAQDIQTGSNTEGKVWEAKVLADYINSSVWGGQWLSGSMELALVNKNRTVIEKIDLSSLATGDLQISVDDTDPSNPVLVFKQNGTEVGRIPASSLLSGVARDATLNGMKLQFKDHSNMVVYEVDFAGLFNQKADKTTTITGTGGLTGGGSLAANRTISLSAATSANINKGVEAHDWGDFREYGLGRDAMNMPDISSIDVQYGRLFRSVQAGHQGSYLSIPYAGITGNNNTQTNLLRLHGGRAFISSTAVFAGSEPAWLELWHSGNNRSNAQNDTHYAFKNHSHTWGEITNKPTEFKPSEHTHTFASISNKPTTLAGYGITNAVALDASGNELGNYTATHSGTFEELRTVVGYLGGNILSMRRNALYGGQFKNKTVGNIWEARSLVNGDWSDWNEFFHDGNHRSNTQNDARYATKIELNTKENAFTKNTAFNKNFGTTAGTVAQGNHAHTFASITAKPTTIAGYGITDGARLNAVNTFTAKNTFNQPVVVPMAVNQNEAINLAQLTASNPIALNRVIVPKRQSIPIGNSYTLSNIDGNLDFVNLSEELFPYDGASVRVTTTLTDDNFFTSGKDYKRLILTSVALGIDNAAPNFSRIQTAVSAFNASVKLEIILTRTATGVLSADTNIYESLTNKDTGVQIFTGFQVSSSVMNVTSNNYRIDLGYAQQEFLLSIRNSPVVIERIK